MAKLQIKWVEFDGGYLGIMPCGLTIAQERIDDGPFMGGYKVRFGTCEIRKIFWDPVEARQRGRELAKKLMLQCIEAIDKDEESFLRGGSS